MTAAQIQELLRQIAFCRTMNAPRRCAHCGDDIAPGTGIPVGQGCWVHRGYCHRYCRAQGAK